MKIIIYYLVIQIVNDIYHLNLQKLIKVEIWFNKIRILVNRCIFS